MKLFLAVIVAAAVVVGVVIATGSSDPDQETAARERVDIAQLTVGGTGKMSTLDVAKAVDQFSTTMLPMALETLVTVDADGKVQPHLAEAVETPDPTTYVYTLRKGVKFWDGTELNAEDVEHSLNHSRAPDSQTANFFGSVKDVKATDKYTVEVTLKQPDASWKYVPAFNGRIFQKKFAEQHGDKLGTPSVLTMGTGPWKIDKLDPTRGMELSRFDQYWGGRPPIARISVKFLADETSVAVAFRAGEIDVAFPADGRAFASTAGTKPLSVPTCSSALLSMNQNLEPWSDVHVRRAVAHAIDRDGIAKALGGIVTPLAQLIPPDQMTAIASESEVEQLYASLPSYEFDVEKARQELAQSEHPDGFSAEIITTPARRELGVVAQVLAENLKQIGIDLKIKSVPVAQFVAKFYAPRDEIPVFLTTYGCATPDPSWFPSGLLSSASAREGGTNLADYKKPAADKLLAEGLATEEAAKRFAAYSKLLQMAQTDLPYLQIYVTQANVALSDDFEWPGVYAFFPLGRPWPLSIEGR